MADICNRCGKMIVIPYNKETFEKNNGKLVTLHRDCEIDDWDKWEKEYGIIKESEI